LFFPLQDFEFVLVAAPGLEAATADEAAFRDETQNASK